MITVWGGRYLYDKWITGVREWKVVDKAKRLKHVQNRHAVKWECPSFIFCSIKYYGRELLHVPPPRTALFSRRGVLRAATGGGNARVGQTSASSRLPCADVLSLSHTVTARQPNFFRSLRQNSSYFYLLLPIAIFFRLVMSRGRWSCTGQTLAKMNAK